MYSHLMKFFKKEVETKNEEKFFEYENAWEFPELAKLCQDQKFSEGDFLELLKHKISLNYANHFPDITIDGKEFGQANSYLTKLPQRDANNLILLWNATKESSNSWYYFAGLNFKITFYVVLKARSEKNKNPPVIAGKINYKDFIIDSYAMCVKSEDGTLVFKPWQTNPDSVPYANLVSAFANKTVSETDVLRVAMCVDPENIIEEWPPFPCSELNINIGDMFDDHQPLLIASNASLRCEKLSAIKKLANDKSSAGLCLTYMLDDLDKTSWCLAKLNEYERAAVLFVNSDSIYKFIRHKLSIGENEKLENFLKKHLLSLKNLDDHQQLNVENLNQCYLLAKPDQLIDGLIILSKNGIPEFSIYLYGIDNPDIVATALTFLSDHPELMTEENFKTLKERPMLGVNIVSSWIALYEQGIYSIARHICYARFIHSNDPTKRYDWEAEHSYVFTLARAVLLLNKFAPTLVTPENIAILMDDHNLAIYIANAWIGLKENNIYQENHLLILKPDSEITRKTKILISLKKNSLYHLRHPLLKNVDTAETIIKGLIDLRKSDHNTLLVEKLLIDHPKDAANLGYAYSVFTKESDIEDFEYFESLVQSNFKWVTIVLDIIFCGPMSQYFELFNDTNYYLKVQRAGVDKDKAYRVIAKLLTPGFLTKILINAHHPINSLLNDYSPSSWPIILNKIEIDTFKKLDFTLNITPMNLFNPAKFLNACTNEQLLYLTEKKLSHLFVTVNKAELATFINELNFDVINVLMKCHVTNLEIISQSIELDTIDAPHLASFINSNADLQKTHLALTENQFSQLIEELKKDSDKQQLATNFTPKQSISLRRFCFN